MTRYKVLIERPARRDLLGILHYITAVLKEPETAAKVYASLKENILSLSHMPLRHRIVRLQSHAAAGIRRFPVGSYLVFYMVDEERYTAHVLRILYNRREWQSIL